MSRIRVLAVTGNADTASDVRRLLASTDVFELVGVEETGKAAIARVAQLIPDLALVDTDVPDMPAVKIARALKQQDAKIKLITMSVAMDALMLRGLIEAGVSNVVGVPLHEDELIPTMQMLYKK